MSYRSKIDPRFHQVTPDQVRAYMLDHGFRLGPYPRPDVYLFVNESIRDQHDGRPLTLGLPVADGTSAEYVVSLEDLTKALSIWNDTYMTEILTEMLRYPTTATNGVSGTNGDAAPAARRPRRKA